jgi:hypothetical protein
MFCAEALMHLLDGVRGRAQLRLQITKETILTATLDLDQKGGDPILRRPLVSASRSAYGPGPHPPDRTVTGSLVTSVVSNNNQAATGGTVRGG